MTLGVRQGGEDGQAYTLILLFMGMTLEKDGVELYVMNKKDEQHDTFNCFAIQEISKYLANVLPNMFCISIVGCNKELFTISKFGDVISPYTI